MQQPVSFELSHHNRCILRSVQDYAEVVISPLLVRNAVVAWRSFLVQLLPLKGG